MSWRPIESAPRDGTLIFILEEGGRVQVAKWCAPDFEDYGWYVQLSNSIHPKRSYSEGKYPTWGVKGWLPIPPDDLK